MSDCKFKTTLLFLATMAFAGIAVAMPQPVFPPDPKDPSNFEPQPLDTGFPKGQVVIQINNIPNDPSGRFHYPEPEGSYIRATLLVDGQLIVESVHGRKIVQVATRNTNEINRLADVLFRAKLNEVHRDIGLVKPNTRKSVTVAAYDWRAKTWSDNVRIVWLEEGCEYQLALEPEDMYDKFQLQALLNRTEALAFELAK